MVKYTCDRCGSDDNAKGVVITIPYEDANLVPKKDLCIECRDELIKFMEGEI